MKYPQLVPDRVCTTQVTVYKKKGINRDGSDKTETIFEGKCFHSEKSNQKLDADRKLILLKGQMLFNGDIAPGESKIDGEAVVAGGITYKIYASEKAKNPDGSVNYTRLELM